MDGKIVQLQSLSKPVYSIFKDENQECKFCSIECSLVALVVRQDDTQEVIPLYLTEYGFKDPETFDNFLGYVDSLDNAKNLLPS